jgi:hypothetical protein
LGFLIVGGIYLVFKLDSIFWWERDYRRSPLFREIFRNLLTTKSSGNQKIFLLKKLKHTTNFENFEKEIKLSKSLEWSENKKKVWHCQTLSLGLVGSLL